MADRIPDNPAKRNFLALLRTRLANERTLLAYIRTALYFLVGGIALIKVEGFERLKILGWLSFIVSSVLVIIGIVRFIKLSKRLDIHRNVLNK